MIFNINSTRGHTGSLLVYLIGSYSQEPLSIVCDCYVMVHYVFISLFIRSLMQICRHVGFDVNNEVVCVCIH